MKTNRIIQLAAGVLLLTACTSDFYEEYVNGRVPVNLGYEVLTAEESTRAAASTTLNDATIASGDAITVKIKNNGADASAYNPYNYTAGDGGAMTPPSPKPYYPTGSTNIDILAYYPANAASNFDVAADQTTDDNYKASDLMVATVTNQAKTTSTVALAFQHKMAKLVVTATKGDGVNTIQTITLKNVKRQVSFNQTTGAVGEATAITGTDVVLFKSGTATTGTGAALIPAQTIEGDVIAIETDQGTAVYNVPAGKAFAANTKYTISVTVNRTAVGATNTITWGSSASLTIQPTVTEKQYVFVPEGAIPGLFTINADGDQVFFSKGNLRATYNGSSWTWSFATNQYDYIGNATGNTKVTSSSPFISENATVDLFGWSTAATTYGIHNTDDSSTYSGDFVDWGATIGSGWRTLTSAEWKYVFGNNSGDKRSGATVGGTSNARYTEATINTDGTGVNGVILFPDGATFAASEATWGTINAASAWGTQCTTAQWTALEAKGCVFLPAAGLRDGTSVYYVGSVGYYWSSTADGTGYAYNVDFHSGYVDPANYNDLFYGFSVRLVRRAWYKEVSSATASDVGKVICSNGHIHTNVSDVTCGGTASGMLAYVGSSTDNSTYTHGLVIALSDANSSSANWSTQNDKCNSYSTSRPSASSSWAMPSKSQWEQMIAASSYANLRDMKGNQSSACGGTAMQSYFYWSSTVSIGSYYWFVDLTGGSWDGFAAGSGSYARAVFAF